MHEIAPTPLDELKIPAFMRRKKLQRKMTRARKQAAVPPARRGATRHTALVIRGAPVIRKAAKPSAARSDGAAKRSRAPGTKRLRPTSPMPTAKPIGTVTHYFDKINVCVIRLAATLHEGDTIVLQGDRGSFTQLVDSMQHERKAIKRGTKGKEVGLKVWQKPLIGELVMKMA